MKTTSLLFAAITLALSGCTGQAAVEETAGEAEESAAGEATSALVDSSAIQALGALARPAGLFQVAGLAGSNISNTQLGQEGLSFVDTLGSTAQIYQSAHFRVIKRASEGGLQIVGREEQWVPPVESSTVVPDNLKQAAIGRLAALGIGASEVLTVRQKTTKMMASEDKVAKLHSHVTIFERGFHGIPVRGSHGSIIHDRAGNFAKLLLHWRPVAADETGNQWGTSMTPAQIVARATQAIEEQGLSERKVKLRYVYVPRTLNADGTATFALKCAAYVGGLLEGAPGGPDRPEEIYIDLDP
jgi:hypothetical protein